MGIRKIVSINEEKCNGCGRCLIDCHEGALQLVNGKAKIINDIYCDGLGDCLKGCPVDAITIIEREAEDFDEEAVEKHMESRRKPLNILGGGGCPSNKFSSIKGENTGLSQWPVQLTLLNPAAPYFKNANLLVTADCVPFAYKNYHNDFLEGKKLCVGCPKLDDVASYIDKLSEIIKLNDLKSITVLRMEVPCCSGIVRAVDEARSTAKSNVKIEVYTISTSGEIINKEII